MGEIDEFSAVVFDVDGVLIDTMNHHAAAWVQAGRELGIEADEEEVYRREGEPGLHTAKDFIKMAGIMSTKARAEMFVAKKEEIYKRIAAKPKLFPAVPDLLAYLFDKGFLLGFVTGTSRHETDKVLPGELQAYFKASVCGDEVMRGKPNPEPYMKAMSALLVAPGKCLVVENAPFGIRSAKTAGATVWAIRSYLTDAHLAGADRLFDSIEGLFAFVKSEK